MSTKKDKTTQWEKSINEITQEVEGLLHGRQIIRKFEETLTSDNFLKDTVGLFWEQYKVNYLFFAVSKICHQIDQDKNSSSLMNLMKDILNNSHEMTVDKWTGGDNIYIQVFSDSFGKPIDGHLDVSTLCADIGTLEQTTQAIKTLRNKRVAHINKNKKYSSRVSSNDLDAAIDLIESLVLKYTNLLTGRSSDKLVADDKDDAWVSIFAKEGKQ